MGLLGYWAIGLLYYLIKFAKQNDCKKLVHYSVARGSLTSMPHLNRKLQEECIGEGTYRVQGDHFTAHVQSEV